MDGVESPRGVFTFLDTLDAGQARLVQLFDADNGLTADIRITSPDVWTIKPYTDDTTCVLRNTHGETLDIIARFYNMGTGSADNVEVTAYDLTDSAAVGDTDYLFFDGLPTDSGSCRETDADDVIFSWDTRSTSIGPHIIRIRAEGIQSEPDTLDNTVLVTFLLDPVDYATEVLENAWDMNEDGDSTWLTDDITDLDGWESSFSDSVSGMFEGTVADNSLSTNRMYLSVDPDTADWIDGRDINQFSLAGKCQRSAQLYLGWVDGNGISGSLLLDTLTTEWEEIEPYDLGIVWSSKTIQELWLRFVPLTGAINMRVRIGWVKLTE